MTRIKGARQVGKVYHIHPLDLAEYVMKDRSPLELFPGKDRSGIIQLDGDIYIQSIDRKAVTRMLK